MIANTEASSSRVWIQGSLEKRINHKQCSRIKKDRMHFTADRLNYCSQIQKAQDNMKKANKWIWINYLQEVDPVMYEEIKRTIWMQREWFIWLKYMLAKFHAYNVSDSPSTKTLMDGLSTEFSTIPSLAMIKTCRRGDFCAAKFVDNQWYQARAKEMGMTNSVML